MKDPVIAADGYSYERTAITRWLREFNSTSPMTNLKLPKPPTLIANLALRHSIEELKVGQVKPLTKRMDMPLTKLIGWDCFVEIGKDAVLTGPALTKYYAGSTDIPSEVLLRCTDAGIKRVIQGFRERGYTIYSRGENLFIARRDGHPSVHMARCTTHSVALDVQLSNDRLFYDGVDSWIFDM